MSGLYLECYLYIYTIHLKCSSEMYHQPFIHVAKLKEVVYHIFSQLPLEYVCKSEAISPYIGLD